jgi:hypothetical protein
MSAQMTQQHTITLPLLKVGLALKKYWKAYMKAFNNVGEVRANALYPRK